VRFSCLFFSPLFLTVSPVPQLRALRPTATAARRRSTGLALRPTIFPMHISCVIALLTDASGEFLLVRRQDSLLWSFPGGAVRSSAPLPVFLAAVCRRQIGLTPHFAAPLVSLEFADMTFAAGWDEILRDRSRACGRILMTGWFSPDALPQDVAPIVRMAVAWHAPRHACVTDAGCAAA
jgi:hypothetical protein